VVLKVVDIDHQGLIPPSKESINSHGSNGVTEWPRGQSIAAGVYWNNEGSISKLLLIGQGMQTAFFNKSNKIKRADEISAE